MEYKYIQALYIPSWICCLGESVSIWNNRWTCPGWIFIPHKPHPFSNEYHTIAEGLTNVLFRVEIVEGKDSLTKTSCSLHYYEFHNDCAELASNLPVINAPSLFRASIVRDYGIYHQSSVATLEKYLGNLVFLSYFFTIIFLGKGLFRTNNHW
mmetsp:Transcript_20701/g.22957  ORF Transcript_20701/g.22957 Transcript_20701/m.22957 type:complete len:153 (-) Transcript_20701:140-598(-)